MTTHILIANYNIQFGRGKDMRYDLDRIAREARSADIVGFQEVTQHWRRTGYQDQAAGLAERLGHQHVFGAGFDVLTGIPGPDGGTRPARRTFGNMVSSRWPIRSTRTLLLPKRSLAGVFDLQRSVTEAVIEAPGGALRVYSAHLSHISAGQRLPQVRALLDFVAAAPRDGGAWDASHDDPDWLDGMATAALPEPAVVLGDFNMTPDSAEYALICGERDPVRGRLPGVDQLRDAWVLAGHREGTGATFPADPTTLRHIDHIFVTPSLAARVTRAFVAEDAVGSDHNPIFVELSI